LFEFFKTKLLHGDKSENFTRRMREEGIMAGANDEQVRNTIMEGFLAPILQMSVINHEIEVGPHGLTNVKKWAIGAELFQPPANVKVDTAKLQRQIEKFFAKLKST